MDAKEYLECGKGFINKEEFDRAIADLSEACRLDPNLGEAKTNLSIAYFNRGIKSYQNGDSNRAITDITEAVRLTPNDDQCFGALGMIYQETGNHDGVISAFTEAIRIAPTADAYGFRSDGYYGKCKEYRAAGDEDNFFKYIDLAIEDLKAALGIPGDPAHDLRRKALEHLTNERELRRKAYDGIRNMGL
jgi:tetratricopeptide (TPR) repeat protein